MAGYISVIEETGKTACDIWHTGMLAIYPQKCPTSAEDRVSVSKTGRHQTSKKPPSVFTNTNPVLRLISSAGPARDNPDPKNWAAENSRFEILKKLK